MGGEKVEFHACPYCYPKMSHRKKKMVSIHKPRPTKIEIGREKKRDVNTSSQAPTRS